MENRDRWRHDGELGPNSAMEESSQTLQWDIPPDEPPDFEEVMVNEDPDQEMQEEKPTVWAPQNNAAFKKRVRLDARTGVFETTLVLPRRKCQHRLKKPPPTVPRMVSKASKHAWETSWAAKYPGEDPVFCWLQTKRRPVKIPYGMSATLDPESRSEAGEEVEEEANTSVESPPNNGEKEVTAADPPGVPDSQSDLRHAATRALGYRPQKRLQRLSGLVKPPSQSPHKRQRVDQLQCRVELQDCRQVLNMEKTDILQERCRLQVAKVELERDRRQLKLREQKLKKAEAQCRQRPGAALPLTPDALREVSSGAKALAEELARDRHALEQQRCTLAAQRKAAGAQQEALAAVRAALALEQGALKAQTEAISKEWELLRDGEAALSRQRKAIEWEQQAFDAGRAALREGMEVLEMERKALRLEQAAQEKERRALRTERQSLEKRRLALMALELGQQGGADNPWSRELSLSGP